MNIPKKLTIVPPDLIPKGLDCPTDNLADLYKLGLLLQTICTQENGVGLSAVQVGIPLNFFVINYDYLSQKESYRFFVNCMYSPLSEQKVESVEGCLSLRNPNNEIRHFEVERFQDISIKGKELVANPKLEIKDFELIPTDYFKIIFQHEIDHARQILISDIGKEVFLWRRK